MTSFTHQDLQTLMDAPPSYEELFGSQDEDRGEQQTSQTEVSDAVAEFHALEESENRRLRYNQSLVVDTRAQPPEAPHFLAPDLRPWMRRGGQGEGENTSVTEFGAQWQGQRPRIPSALYGFRRENERTISSLISSPSNRPESTDRSRTNGIDSMTTGRSQTNRIETRSTGSSRPNPTRIETRQTGSNIMSPPHSNLPKTSKSVNQSRTRLTGRKPILVDASSSSFGSINGQDCREQRYELPRRYTLVESLFAPMEYGPTRKKAPRIRGKDHPRGCAVD